MNRVGTPTDDSCTVPAKRRAGPARRRCLILPSTLEPTAQVAGGGEWTYEDHEPDTRDQRTGSVVNLDWARIVHSERTSVTDIAEAQTAPTEESGERRRRKGTGLDAMVLPELKQLAQSLGVKSGGMRKSQLIDAIRAAQSGGSGGGNGSSRGAGNGAAPTETRSPRAERSHAGEPAHPRGRDPDGRASC